MNTYMLSTWTAQVFHFLPFPNFTVFFTWPSYKTASLWCKERYIFDTTTGQSKEFYLNYTYVIGMRIRASRMSWSKLEFFRCCVSQVLYRKWSASTSLNEQCELLCRLLQEHLSPQWFPLAAICGQFPPSNQQCCICNVVNNKWEKFFI